MNRSELRALAEAATPGPWGSDETEFHHPAAIVSKSTRETWENGDGGGPIDAPVFVADCEYTTPENKAWLQAADPTTVLALLDRLEGAEARLGMLCEAVGDFHTAITCTDSSLVIPDMLAEMYEERDRARAFLEDTQ